MSQDSVRTVPNRAHFTICQTEPKPLLEQDMQPRHSGPLSHEMQMQYIHSTVVPSANQNRPMNSAMVTVEAGLPSVRRNVQIHGATACFFRHTWSL